MSGSDGESEVPDHLKEGSTFGDRDDESDPYRAQRDRDAGAADDSDTPDPLDELVSEIEAVRDGDGTPSVGGRDPTFAAYFEFLRQNPERMGAIIDQLAEASETSIDADPEKKSSVFRLLLRVGLQKAAPEEWERITEASAEYARRNP